MRLRLLPASSPDVPFDDEVAIRDCGTAVYAWWLLAVSFAAILAGVFSARFSSPSLDPALFCLLMGLLAAGGAAALRPQSAAVLSLCALYALLASIGFDFVAWDSARLLLRCIAIMAGAGALLALLPVKGKQVVVSALIVLHFGGILTAAWPDTWVASQLWTHFYRPYLQFMFLDESHHYFAGGPHTCSLLWFCVYYQPNDDGSPDCRWVRVPELDRNGRPTRPDGSPDWPRTEYNRHLKLPDSVDSMAWTLGYDFGLVSQRRVQAQAVTSTAIDHGLRHRPARHEPPGRLVPPPRKLVM